MCLPFCHEWKKIDERIEKFWSERADNIVQEDVIFVLQCKKCGIIKFKKL